MSRRRRMLLGSGGLTIRQSLQLWLDAADTSTITESGGSVSQWNDKSGKGNNATQGTGGQQPTTGAATQNSRNVLTFDGGDSFDLPSALNTIPQGANTIFIVAKRASEDGTFDSCFGAGISGSSNQYFVAFNTTAGTISYRSNNGSGAASSTGNTNTNFNIIRGRRSGTAMNIAINGETEITSTSGADAVGTNAAVVGSTVSSALALNGSIAEILVYNRSLSVSEIAVVENYLSSKWGVALA